MDMGTGEPRPGPRQLDDSKSNPGGAPPPHFGHAISEPGNARRRVTRHGAAATAPHVVGGWLRPVVGTRIIDGAPCPHSTGHSCGIYRDRPSTCRDFACAWLKPESGLPTGFRPDKVGVIVLDNRLTWRGIPVDLLVAAGTPDDDFTFLV
jgi:hypothetical protein